LSNTTFYKFESLKFVSYKLAQDKIALGILILLKFIYWKAELYKLARVIAAAALLDIDLFVLLYWTI
jgi:hypothetical protein